MKTIPEDELLALIGKTENEQETFLLSRGFLLDKMCCYDDHYSHDESLADLAERLWERNKTIRPNVVEQTCIDVKKASGYHKLTMVEWFMFNYAKPIHRIVAAIIALQRAGVEI